MPHLFYFILVLPTLAVVGPGIHPSDSTIWLSDQVACRVALRIYIYNVLHLGFRSNIYMNRSPRNLHSEGEGGTKLHFKRIKISNEKQMHFYLCPKTTALICNWKGNSFRNLTYTHLLTKKETHLFGMPYCSLRSLPGRVSSGSIGTPSWKSIHNLLKLIGWKLYASGRPMKCRRSRLHSFRR